MYNIEDLIKGTLKSDIIADNEIDILFINIIDKGGYNSYAKFDVPMSGRYIEKTGNIESIYDLEILIKYNDIDKFNKICKSDNIYCTFPTTKENGTKAIINKSLKLTNKQYEEFIQSRIGYSRYTLTLEENSLSTKENETNIININDLRNNALILDDSILSDLINFYKTTLDIIDIVKTTIANIIATIKKIVSVYNSIVTAITELQNSLFALSAAIDTIISLPNSLYNHLGNIINNFSKLSDNSIGQFNIIKKFFTTFNFKTYNKDLSNISNDNYNATNTINQYIASKLFSNACEILSEVDFETQEEINTKIEELNQIYDKISFIDNIQVLSILERQKNICNIILNEKRSLLVGFVNFETYNINSFDFCYLLYNDIEKLLNLLKWNPEIKDLRLLNGNIKVIL